MAGQSVIELLGELLMFGLAIFGSALVVMVALGIIAGLGWVGEEIYKWVWKSDK